MPQTIGPHLFVGGYRINDKVLASIQEASRKTGVSFAFLMAQAGRESAFNAQAGNRRSSAAGLYQFTAGTWMQVMKDHGAEHGHADLASRIKVDTAGDYDVADAKLRERILDMRRDPGLAAVMAGEYAKDNRAVLEQRLGRPVNSADLYLAHFLGPQGATRFLKALDATPNQAAAKFVPVAAQVNPRVFYHKGRPADLATVYTRIRISLDSQRHYTHLEGVPAWEAMWTENISFRPQYATTESRREVGPEPWIEQSMDKIERPAAAVETWVASAADGIEAAATPTTAAQAARRLAEVANLVHTVAEQPAAAAESEAGKAAKPGNGFHTLWLSLTGRREI